MRKATRVSAAVRVLGLAVLLACSVSGAANAQEDRARAAALNAIYDNRGVPAFGNAGGVTIVEFYDYRCGYCKASEPGLERLLQEDNGLRVMYMDFPKLSALSATAAIATLAGMRQGPDKYLKFHNTLMGRNFALSEDSMYKAAQNAGIDVQRLQNDMRDPAIVAQIQGEIALAESVGVRMTPSFIIGGRFFPGYASYDQLKQRVEDARSGGQGE